MARQFVGKISKIPKLPLMKCQIRVSCRLYQFPSKRCQGETQWRQGDRKESLGQRQRRRSRWGERPGAQVAKGRDQDKDENNELLVNIHLVHVLPNTTFFSFDFLRFFFLFQPVILGKFQEFFQDKFFI